MATKTITITEDAYNILKSSKNDDESFTDAIVRIAKKDTLSELAGVLTKKDATELRESIKASRLATEQRLKQTRARLE